MSVVKITEENFKQEVLNSDKPVLIDFFATWCGPCQMLSPIVDEVAEEVDDVKICKIDIDQEADLAQTFRIMTVPTLVYVKNAEIVCKTMGVKQKEEILETMKSVF